jgi:hypothetical protein
MNYTTLLKADAAINLILGILLVGISLLKGLTHLQKRKLASSDEK